MLRKPAHTAPPSPPPLHLHKPKEARARTSVIHLQSQITNRFYGSWRGGKGRGMGRVLAASNRIAGSKVAAPPALTLDATKLNRQLPPTHSQYPHTRSSYTT